jgi:hypothetical protein
MYGDRSNVMGMQPEGQVKYHEGVVYCAALLFNVVCFDSYSCITHESKLRVEVSITAFQGSLTTKGTGQMGPTGTGLRACVSHESS